MSTVAAIPPEILSQIFQQLPRPSVHQSMLVCKSWYPTALQIFYNQILISGDAVIRLKKTLREMSKNRINLKENCSLVKRLTINDEPFMLDLLPLMFFELFTNLKSIDFGCSYFNSKYMEFFLEAPKGSCLKNIEEIAPPSLETIALNKSYNSLCRKFQDTLVHFSTDDLNYVHGQLAFDIRIILPNYKNITHLSISNTLNFPGTTCDLFTLISLCPNLTNLNFFSVSELDVSFNLTSSSTLQLRNISKLKLKSIVLRICTSSLKPAYFEYLVSYLSTYHHLDKLFLAIAGNVMDQWIESNNSNNTILQFADALKTVKNLHITVLPFSPLIRSNIISQEKRRVNLIKFWKFISTIKSHRWLSCEAIYQRRHGDYQRNVGYEINIKGDNTMKIYSLVYQFWDSMDDIEETKRNGVTYRLPEVGPSIIDCLNIVNVPEIQTIITLTNALINCPRLACLSIIIDGYDNFLGKCVLLSIGNIHFYTTQLKPRSLLFSERKLNRVTLRGFWSLTNDVLNTIATFLPDLEEVEITETTDNTCVDQELDLTGFKHLKNLIVHGRTPMKLAVDDGLLWYIKLKVNFSGGRKEKYYMESQNFNEEGCMLYTISINCNRLDRITCIANKVYQVIRLK